MGDKPGKFELADKGTILLDEIGEMSSHLQAKLLHVLQDGEYTRLGGRRATRVDARVLASTTGSCAKQSPTDNQRRSLLSARCRHNRDSAVERTASGHPAPVSSLRRKVRRFDMKSSVKQLPAELMDAFIRSEWPGNVASWKTSSDGF